jgi:hypothetical protein
MKSIILIGSLIIVLFSAGKSNSQSVKIVSNQGNWQLLVDNQPYFIKGVVGHTYLEKVKEYGGNSVRIGSRKEELDLAQKLGLTALVNLPASSERYGFDYNNAADVQKQLEKAVEIVQKTKEHPAVMMWAIGNEIDWIPGNIPYNPKLWDAINDIAKAIKAVDPNHPVMTVIGTSSMKKIAEIVRQCPDLDLLGINTYGDIYTLPDTLKKYGWTKPFVIAEWGPDGYWEVSKTSWGAPYEQTGREKLFCYEQKYRKAIESSNCLGSYVFYWYHKQEITHTWFSMFNENGEETPLPKLMKMMWTGERAANLAPVVDSINIDQFIRYQDIILKAGSVHNATVTASDPEKDKLFYTWEVRPEAVYASYAGQGEKTPEVLQGLIQNQDKIIRFSAPKEKGAYRLFVYVFDGNNQFSTANLPLMVE